MSSPTVRTPRVGSLAGGLRSHILRGVVKKKKKKKKFRAQRRDREKRYTKEPGIW